MDLLVSSIFYFSVFVTMLSKPSFSKSKTMTALFDSLENIFEKKEETTNYQEFRLFPQCFLPFPKQVSMFYLHLFVVYTVCFQFEPV